MKLTKFLHDQGYDLIEGPVRNHKLFQLWLKKDFDKAQLYYSKVDEAFKSDVVLEEIENPALSIDSTKKDEYNFNIGITLLDQILKSLGLGMLELSAEIKSGRKITISYDNSVSRECTLGNIDSYFYAADFKHPNPNLLRNANRNDILFVTGVILAKNILVDIETDFTVDASLTAKLNELADGKMDFSSNSSNRLKMVSGGNSFFPVAVKAHRVDFDRSVFKKMTLVTDTRNFF